jgi:Tol biopolymer transport system component
VAGTEPPRIVSTGKPLALLPTGWSPDGRFLVAEQLGAGGKNDLLVVPAKGGEPQPLIANPEVWEHSGAVSPDGRWLAFDSNESGRYEVYVTSFPTPGRKWQVSQSGGRDARWRGDGRELLYNNGSAFHSAVVDGSGPRFQVGAGRRLFDLPFKLDDGVAYDVTRDGQRFLLVEPMADNEIAPITLVQDWNAQLGRAMAGSR